MIRAFTLFSSAQSSSIYFAEFAELFAREATKLNSCVYELVLIGDDDGKLHDGNSYGLHLVTESFLLPDPVLIIKNLCCFSALGYSHNF